jgi:hypothetical protein
LKKKDYLFAISLNLEKGEKEKGERVKGENEKKERETERGRERQREI